MWEFTINRKQPQVPLFPWGAVFICSLTLPCLMLFAFAVIAHCRSIDVIQQQVRGFSIENSRSHCCAQHHIDPGTGGRLICDRSIILRCITAWFGSTDNFESTVQTRVLAVLVYQLRYQVFSYWRIVQASSPALWVLLDFWNTEADDLVEITLAAVILCFMFLPCICALVPGSWLESTFCIVSTLLHRIRYAQTQKARRSSQLEISIFSWALPPKRWASSSVRCPQMAPVMVPNP